MLARRGILAGLVGAILALPIDAAADGGAYIELDQTHYLPGTSAVGTGYVSIPRKHQDLLEHGPFYVYVVPPRASIEPNRPIPDGVIRVGTATIEHDSGKTFAIRVAFTVPDLVGDYYSVQLCNDPCTIAGFRETLSGSISIVQTPREALLLNEQQKLSGQYWSVRRKLRKANRALEELGLTAGEDGLKVAALTAEVEQLEAELAAAEPTRFVDRASASDDRPLVEAWALIAIVGALIVALLAIALALVFARRAPRVEVPDTIAELELEAEFLRALR